MTQGRGVVVAGGGVVGLACARALAQRGARVRLFDAGAGSREASWAAAGILGVGSEFSSEALVDGPLSRAAREAFRSWPATVATLEAEAGLSLGWSDEGTLLVARDDRDRDALRRQAEMLASGGVGVRWLSAPEARRIEPRLGPEVVGALRVAEARLDNRALWAALRRSCQALGVETSDSEPVEEVLFASDGSVEGVRTRSGAVPADHVVVAAGAWSEALARRTGIALPSVPVKGQMLRLDAPDGFLRHVVMRGLSYAVPRRGAGIVVGTTSEDAGFSRETDETVLRRLVDECARLVPSLSSLRRVEAWSGLRPRLCDGLPAIGPVPGRAGLHLATGHYRTGILLCEWTAQAVARALLDGDVRGIEAFAPDRASLASPTA